MTDDQKIRFRELSLRFLDSYNPQPDRAIVIADAILSFDGEIDEQLPMRHISHRFVYAATRLIEKECVLGSSPMERWISDWNEEFGV